MGSLFGRGFDSLQLHEVEMNPETFFFRGFVLVQNKEGGEAYGPDLVFLTKNELERLKRGLPLSPQGEEKFTPV